jgi:hypothetical protein
MPNNGQNHTRQQEKLDSETIELLIPRSLKLALHEKENVERCRYKDDFHNRVVKGMKGGKQVQVPGYKDCREQRLRFK